MDTPTDGQQTPPENEKAVITWLQQTAIPVQHVVAGNGFADLQPLKQMLQDVKVVGLGEPTHGTREIFQLKHRLVEFLVTEMQFTTFAMECSFAACQPINAYVLDGKGDRATVLTGTGYVVWDTEEVSDLLDWLRSYNQSVPDEKKVTFSGVDIPYNDIGRDAVLSYLRTVAPDRLAATETLFAALASEEAKWLLRVDDASKQTLVQLLPQVQAVIDHLTANKDGFVRRSSLRAFDQAVQYTRVMKQFIMANATDFLPPSHYKGDVRSRCMAENLIALADRARPDAKWIMWAHNGHISVPDHAIEEPTMGSYLRAKYGSAYFAFGFEFNQGSFQTRTVLPDKFLGDLQEVTLPPAPTASLAWYLSRINRDVAIVNLRAPVSNPVIEAWIDTPQAVHDVGWLYDAPYNGLAPLSIRIYDGIIFLEHTTATRPTANAANTIAQRDGL